MGIKCKDGGYSFRLNLQYYMQMEKKYYVHWWLMLVGSGR